MMCLLSPTKTLFEEPIADFVFSSPHEPLVSPRSLILDCCKMQSKVKIKSLMSLSESLAELNFQRYQHFDEQPFFPAGFLFDGPSFQKLNLRTFSTEELSHVDDRLCILSGLYGFLKPRERVRPYRLEMGTRLNVDNEANLYRFWAKHSLTNEFIQMAQAKNIKFVVNCASQEYAKVLDFDAMLDAGMQVIDVHFKPGKSKRAHLPSTFAKQARGEFARFCCLSNPQTIEALYSFKGNEGHFTFCPELSSSTLLMFDRHEVGKEAEIQGEETKRPRYE